MKKVFSACLLTVAVFAYAQNPVTSLPFELHGDHIIIQVSVDGSESLDFIFDTGDGLSVIDIDVAKELGLNLDHKQATKSAAGTITGALIKHNKVAINDLIMESNIKVYATSLNHLEMSIGRNVDGIIGYDLLHHHVIEIDYDQMMFNIYDFGKYPIKGNPVSFKLVNVIPTIEGSVTLNNGETINGTFYLNTGAGTTVDFNTPFANANGIIDKTGDHYWYMVKGIGNTESKHYEGRVANFSFKDQSVDNLPIGISQSMTGLQGDAKVSGIIGNKLLKQYNMIIDVKKGMVYMESNKNKGEEHAVNCSGLDVQLNEEQTKVLIHQVFEGTPGDDAGIQKDDVLISVNGSDAFEMGLIAVEDELKKDGETVTLVILSNGQEKKLTIDLKELL
ncbi:MAG: aspartyl protease family protein [Cyclobacteriaceae bacterium]